MRVKITFAVLLLVAAGAAHGNAGLTSAGVSQNPTPQPEEPTLAQVAPVAGTAVPGAPGTAVANAGVPGAVATPGGNAVTGNGANAAPVATTRVVTPPPPDPATLPVSVIRPLNKAVADAGAAPTSTMAAKPAPPAPFATGGGRPDAEPAAAAPPPVAAPVPPPVRTPPPSTPGLARAEVTPRTNAEPPPEPTPDASSSSVIFYSGSGLAGAILLLSIGAFLRSRTTE